MDEVEKSKHAHPQGDTVFGKIIRGEIPAKFVYEDDKCVAINDLNPQAPVHVLVIPRKPITQLSKSEDEDTLLLGHLLHVARKIAVQLKINESGFRLVINDGPQGCQSVYHLHVHLLAGRQMGWPPG
jgi:histidine triad (HIT) family protein